ncbi:hypothetical protein M407DRAFT_243481 [Tulasnella calospora MUT 4182]|uniref:Uncharacterized protein n=1 Tax=Tulasnella calospora MUT 4182 TaxID=1051891 RepID=A0A0C3QJ32_9AGAM|nr:hypothetical protein M407DRAFT_243481 [Tulasnella calospora MUT 4182]
MSSEKATRHPPESSVVQSALAMLLASIQEQNHHSAMLNDQRESDSFQSEIERLDRLAEDRRIATESVQLAAESVQLAASRAAAALLRLRKPGGPRKTRVFDFLLFCQQTAATTTRPITLLELLENM